MKMFDADETRMIGLPYGEKNYDVKPFSSDTGTLRMDGRTDTDEQTDRQTDGQIFYSNFARQYADAR